MFTIDEKPTERPHGLMDHAGAFVAGLQIAAVAAEAVAIAALV
jgi:hypothetical protein